MLDDDVYISPETRLDDTLLAHLRTELREWCHENFLKASMPAFEDFLVSEAKKNSWHPIREYLDKLPKWDGVDRISVLGACFPKSPIAARALEIWLAGSVRRIYEPGQQNIALVLASEKQELGKSTFIEWLCPLKNLFFSGPIDPGNKDSRLRLATVWVQEICELGATTRKSDVEALKAIITQQQVRERKSYGHFDIVKPATVSFIGTVNEVGAGFLQDQTGNRRFLVIVADEMSWHYTELDLAQVWSQAKIAYENGKAVMTAAEKAIRDEINENFTSRPIILDDFDSLFEAGTSDDFVSVRDIFSSLVALDHQKTPQNTTMVKQHIGKMGLKQMRGNAPGRPRGYNLRRR
jgi:predicted P-loop ATPase